MVHKSTLLFSFLAVVLFTCLGVVVAYLVDGSKATPASQVEGSVTHAQIPLTTPAARTSYDARSVLMWDTARQEIFFQQNGFERLPIASLTKLMTAMIALDHGITWEQPASIELPEYVIGGRLLLHPGEEATMRDLFYASLLGSANNATLAYVRTLGITPEDFVEEMNRKAIALGLEQTHFVEVTGLDPDNVSTAYEIARLAEYAFAHYPQIRHATSAAEYSFTVRGSGRAHTLKNTNKLISESGLSVFGSKTGYLDEAGYCLVTHTDGYIGVILGSRSEQGHFGDMQRLLAGQR